MVPIALATILMVGSLCPAAGRRIPHLHSFPGHRQAVITRVLSGAYSSLPEWSSFNRVQAQQVASDGSVAPPVIYPTDFGADPTGHEDSTPAFNAAVSMMIHRGGQPLNGSTDGTLINLGGATIDLAGGNYSLSSPIRVPDGFSNFGLQRGSLFAGPAFPVDAEHSLIEIGTSRCTSKFCTSTVRLTDLTLNGAHRAGGLATVQHGQYALVGPAVMGYAFTRVGVSLPGTGGSYISESWFGQWPPFQRQTNTSLVSATAVNISGAEHDCMLTQLVIWSGRVGVANGNGANQFNGVHTWNLNARWGGIGIHLLEGRARIENCYMDFAPIVAVNPRQLVVTGTLFLGAASVVLVAPAWDGPLDGVTIANNAFLNHNASVTVDDPFGHYKSVTDVDISGNQYVDQNPTPNTRIVVNATATAASELTLDVGGKLLFPNVSIREVWCVTQNGQPAAVAIGASFSHQTVKVAFAPPYSGKVLCTIDQSKYSRRYSLK